ncbi:MAG: response regulator transcription factor [Candidatus Solibacter usitatus]|nr:response regulator transcription factor [Candidatus Solibacter usitatus]
MPHEILLVDDHKIMRDGIKAILNLHEDFHVSGEAEDGLEAVQLCRRLQPAIVLIDINLPKLNGIEATAEILRYCPETKVIVLSMYDDEDSVVSAVRSGARGFVLKHSSDNNDLIEALRSVAKGGLYFSPEVSNQLMDRMRRGDLEDKRVPKVLQGLSPREVQVLRLVAEGKTSKEIAVLLNLGLQTIRGYRKTMMKKLGVGNIAGLTQLALSAGLTRLQQTPAEPAE